MPATVRLHLAEVQLQRMLVGPGGEVTKYVTGLTRDIANLGRLYCPVDTGNLRGSITPAVRTEGTRVIGTVGTPVEYAAAVHEGSKPHIIRPKTPARWVIKDGKRVKVGGVLAWGAATAGGKPTRFATFVRHPGTKAQPFLRRAMEERLAREP